VAAVYRPPLNQVPVPAGGGRSAPNCGQRSGNWPSKGPTHGGRYAQRGQTSASLGVSRKLGYRDDGIERTSCAASRQ
jgi:hypothetical protein